MEVPTHGWRLLIVPLLSKASFQTFQDAERLQMSSKFKQMLYFGRRGCLVGLLWARLTTLAGSSVVRLVSVAAFALSNWIRPFSEEVGSWSAGRLKTARTRRWLNYKKRQLQRMRREETACHTDDTWDGSEKKLAHCAVDLSGREGWELFSHEHIDISISATFVFTTGGESERSI